MVNKNCGHKGPCSCIAKKPTCKVGCSTKKDKTYTYDAYANEEGYNVNVDVDYENVNVDNYNVKKSDKYNYDDAEIVESNYGAKKSNKYNYDSYSNYGCADNTCAKNQCVEGYQCGDYKKTLCKCGIENCDCYNEILSSSLNAYYDASGVLIQPNSGAFFDASGNSVFPTNGTGLLSRGGGCCGINGGINIAGDNTGRYTNCTKTVDTVNGTFCTVMDKLTGQISEIDCRLCPINKCAIVIYHVRADRYFVDNIPKNCLCPVLYIGTQVFKIKENGTFCTNLNILDLLNPVTTINGGASPFIGGLYPGSGIPTISTNIDDIPLVVNTGLNGGLINGNGNGVIPRNGVINGNGLINELIYLQCGCKRYRVEFDPLLCASSGVLQPALNAVFIIGGFTGENASLRQATGYATFEISSLNTFGAISIILDLQGAIGTTSRIVRLNKPTITTDINGTIIRTPTLSRVTFQFGAEESISDSALSSATLRAVINNRTTEPFRFTRHAQSVNGLQFRPIGVIERTAGSTDSNVNLFLPRSFLGSISSLGIVGDTENFLGLETVGPVGIPTIGAPFTGRSPLEAISTLIETVVGDETISTTVVAPGIGAATNSTSITLLDAADLDFSGKLIAVLEKAASDVSSANPVLLYSPGRITRVSPDVVTITKELYPLAGAANGSTGAITWVNVKPSVGVVGSNSILVSFTSLPPDPDDE